MPLLYEVYDAIPANNNTDPPTGAPEGVTRVKQLNDILRYLMAAVFEIGEVATGVGTIAAQDANAVSLTGGAISNIALTASSINSTNNINALALTAGLIPLARIPTVADSVRLFSNTVQELYDGIYPIGSVMLMARERATIPMPFGVVAVWVRYSTNRYLKVLDSANYTGSELTIQTGGSTTINTVNAGDHDHGGSTALHQLSVSNLPSHNHTARGGATGGNPTGYTTGGTARNDGSMENTGSTGGDVPHKHNISTDGAHNHAVALDAAFLATTAWRRTA